jgi:hypothetical protein
LAQIKPKDFYKIKNGGKNMKTNKQNHDKKKSAAAERCGLTVLRHFIRPRHVWVVRQIVSLQAKSGFGLNEVIGIAAGIIIAVVVVIPGLQGFASSILNNLTSWWNNMASSVFATH